MIGRALIVLLALVASAAPARAQAVQILPRFDFHLGAEHLGSDDRRFVWDTNFGGELDLLDYGRGRATFEANYQAILGEEFKKFDPNQGNYILVGVGSVRSGALEVAGVFYHQSRHLGDRANRQAVDWNMLGGRVRHALTRGRVSVNSRADLRSVIQHTFVDYRWELDSRLDARAAVGPGIALIAGGGVRLLGVDGSRSRGTQHGFRAEGGVRIEGRGAAAELFLAVERRIDPYPLQSSTETWLTGGFRLLSR